VNILDLHTQYTTKQLKVKLKKELLDIPWWMRLCSTPKQIKDYHNKTKNMLEDK